MEPWKKKMGIIYGVFGMAIAGILGLIGYSGYVGTKQLNEQVSSQEQPQEKPQEKPKPAYFAAVPMYSEGGLALTSGDFDGDEDLDLIIGSYYQGGTIYFSENQGNGSFNPLLKVAEVPQYYESGIALTSGDFDNDEDLDFIVGSYNNEGRLYLFENDGKGNFAPYTP